MRRRRGRARKAGARERNGRLLRQAETPRQVAAAMPHRKGLGELATDQRACTQLGRLVLRGDLDATHGLAGETYLGLWRGYVWTLAGPRELAQGNGHGMSCGGCEVPLHCRCWFRRKVFEEAQRVLRGSGQPASLVVTCVVLHDLPLTWGWGIEPLRLGLGALAHHFGLQPRGSVVVRNAASQIARSPGP